MKKILLLSIMLISLFLVGCSNDTYLAPGTIESREQQVQQMSVEQEEQTQQEIKNDFAMKEKCAKYADSWDKQVSDGWKDYDAYWYCDTSVYYSKYRNSCIGESQCSAGGMGFNRIVDLLENTTLYSDDDINGDVDEFRRLHDLYYNG